VSSGVTGVTISRGVLSQGRKLLKQRALATVGDPLANIQKKF